MNGTELKNIVQAVADSLYQNILPYLNNLDIHNSLDSIVLDNFPVASGLSAYQIAQNNGFVGTEIEWLASLIGKDGLQGVQGIQGIQGERGIDCSAVVGSVIFHASSNVPNGYLECNGALISRSVYSALFGVIGTVYGAGDGSTTFKLPDLRGEFIRCFDHGRGVDVSRAFGSFQDQSIISHNHIDGASNGGYGGSYSYVNGASAYYRLGTIAVNSYHDYTSSTGGVETRPRNIALLPCIKY